MSNLKATTAESPRFSIVLVLLVLATVFAYQPAWRGLPVWDDAAHLTPPERQSLNGLARIWIEPGETQQYYPVVHSAFWVEHRLWGDSTLGYHFVNILLHVTAALLLLKILQTLEIPAAALAAAIFALHPVQVESVAWMSELKNTLSAVCYFGAALAYLQFDRTGNRSAYAGALALFVVGLMAKTVIATLPAALLVVFWWQRGKLSWKQDVLRLIPFFAAGIAAGILTSWMERKFVGAEGAEFNFSIVERFLIAGRAIWFYLGKLFWPADLIFSYSRWKISGAVWWQYLYPASVALLIGAFWLVRRRNRGPLAALLFFIGTLFPALGFWTVFPFKYSFVADHFQYLASCGPIVAASVGMHALFRRFRERGLLWERAFCVILLTMLGILTWCQSRMYSDIETLWQTTIARNPDSWLAQNDLGAIYYERGQLEPAIAHFRTSLAIQPENSEAQNNLGVALAKKGEVDEAILRFQKALAIRPSFAEAHCSLGNALLRKGQTNEAILHFEQAVAIRPDLARLHHTLGSALLEQGQLDRAAGQFQDTIKLAPDDNQAHYDLGIALRQMGRTDEAVLEFQQAATIRPDFAEAQNNLGYGLLQQGRAEEAVKHLEKALEIRPDYAQAHYNLGNALLKKGQADEAVIQFQKLLAVEPNSVEAIKNLAGIAWQWATSPNPALRNGAKAVALARQTDELARGESPMMAAILAAAHAEAGEYSQAVEAGRRALQLATRQNNAALVASIQTQLKCYEASSPFRDPGPSGKP